MQRQANAGAANVAQEHVEPQAGGSQDPIDVDEVMREEPGLMAGLTDIDILFDRMLAHMARL